MEFFVCLTNELLKMNQETKQWIGKEELNWEPDSIKPNREKSFFEMSEKIWQIGYPKRE